MKKEFTDNLLRWHDINGRHDLPWNKTKDSYKILLSEVILQQTRVNQGMSYYLKFIEEYPSIYKLAEATEDQVLKSWEGLGYYSRARNLHKGALFIITNYGGKIPKDRLKIQKIPGIGPYTSAAIASFAYDLPHAVVDGNVVRVISRYFGIRESVLVAETKNRIEELAAKLLVKDDSARYNRAIMDLGATVCLSKAPTCQNCPLLEGCLAKKEDRTGEIPHKHKKTEKKPREFSLLVELGQNGEIIVAKRTEKDIWKGLYFLPNVDYKKEDHDKLMTMQHDLTHRRLTIQFYKKKKRHLEELIAGAEEVVDKYAFPTPIRNMFIQLMDRKGKKRH